MLDQPPGQAPVAQRTNPERSFAEEVRAQEVELGSNSTSTGNNSDIVQALRRGSSQSLNQTGQQAARRNLNIQPTLTIRPGFPVRVIINRDLVLEPYKR